MGISGYVPFYNNSQTVLAAVDSLRRQQPPLNEVFAIDDGSNDNSAHLLQAAGVRVLKQPMNLGRGAARRMAMEVALHEFVLCCDATNILPDDFAARALSWFEDQKVAAVVGLITDSNPQGVVSRWRARNLFKAGVPRSASKGASLITYGSMVRSSAVKQVGGFDGSLRHSEDIELGSRLEEANFDIVSDPSLKVYCNIKNSLPQVLERYWRWYVGKDEFMSIKIYFKNIVFSVRTMAVGDLRAGDPLAVLISLIIPHYQLWKALKGKSWHCIGRVRLK
ncbi:MAG: glycosyltransferase [Synechococcus sp.]|nr:glycosyltransferase [Synechococcus sp.]